MPKIGMRIVKSSIAVFSCFLIYLIRGEQGVPFYSAIAAILCMQPCVANSIKVGKNRVIGTLIGGIFGMVILLLERGLFASSPLMIQYMLISVAIIPLIYITVLIEKTTASYISCVVFLSVTVSHAIDVNPYGFAFNRILDTLIGIFVSIIINRIWLPKNEDEAMEEHVEEVIEEMVDEEMIDEELIEEALKEEVLEEEAKLDKATLIKIKEIQEKAAKEISLLKQQAHEKSNK
ncbi:Fusaric acid resistance protein-like [Clostridium collagenovorans DSM 3089]|uniref:Fusaric acid resistance protein-like n=1 Tax=Clostridium collagenovorans DSM 3089 TaxID=1121306 RepID=A0A1M5V908_9CLOT|nr:aromatic acid exporter family protein [Clostridium collagenovorans]SHH71710.1 Fusaric acid resistance protein-like [Clostridium collagenovorans DSM 3089]